MDFFDRDTFKLSKMAAIMYVTLIFAFCRAGNLHKSVINSFVKHRETNMKIILYNVKLDDFLSELSKLRLILLNNYDCNVN